MASPTLLQQVGNLISSANALIALGLALRAHASGEALDPQLRNRILDVLDVLDCRAALDALPPPQAATPLAGIRSDFLLGAKMLDDGAAGTGWTHDEQALLQSCGDVSAGFPAVLKNRLLTELNGLGERLSAPGGAFLDVGVGVAALSIAMLRQWPSLKIVGVDPWAASLAIARRNLDDTGFAAQVELRQQAGEDLTDIEAFDLAWVPGAFMPQTAVQTLIERVRRALRPGGWVLFAIPSLGADPISASTTRLRTALWGGTPMVPEEAQGYLERAGLSDVRLPDMPAGSPIVVAAARRP